MNNIERIIGKDKYDEIIKLDLYDRCLELVKILFVNITDRENKPYINHLIRVSDKMSTLDGKVLGLLHDVVEDIDGITFDDLVSFGVNNNTIDALKLVTNDKSLESLTGSKKLAKYNEKIDNIINSKNLLAIELKYSDMSDNYNKDRLSNLDKDLKDWYELKYSKNIKKLESILIERGII